jgi:predicted RecB family nuclease
MTQSRTRKKSNHFLLRNFRGISPEDVSKLSDIGIKNVDQMLKAGNTSEARKNLSERADIPLERILELVKLSDLSRIPGLKGIRARLYHDAGVDTLEKLAGWNPNQLRSMLQVFVMRTNFDGIPPLPKETESQVVMANKLPKVVDY